MFRGVIRGSPNGALALPSLSNRLTLLHFDVRLMLKDNIWKFLRRLLIMKTEKAQLKRINVRVSEKVKSYFESKSRDTGVSQSSLMALALEEYIDQKIMIEFTKKIPNLNDLNEGNKL